MKDEKKANDDALKDTDGVVTVVKAVVIGNEVADVYDSILKEGGFSSGGQVADDDGKGTLERRPKDSFYWYKKVIESNGKDLD